MISREEFNAWKKEVWAAMTDEERRLIFEARARLRREDRRQKYLEYLRSEKWALLRRLKIEEAGGRCEICNAAGPMEVHHRTYVRLFDERLSDLTALCPDCHGLYEENKRAKRAQETSHEDRLHPSSRELALSAERFGGAGVGPHPREGRTAADDEGSDPYQ